MGSVSLDHSEVGRDFPQLYVCLRHFHGPHDWNSVDRLLLGQEAEV